MRPVVISVRGAYTDGSCLPNAVPAKGIKLQVVTALTQVFAAHLAP